jgi:hypothetical protein
MRDSGLRLAQAVLESRKQRIPGLEVIRSQGDMNERWCLHLSSN